MSAVIAIRNAIDMLQLSDLEHIPSLQEAFIQRISVLQIEYKNSQQQFTVETIAQSKNIKQKSKKKTMTDFAVEVLTQQNDLHFKNIWTKIENLGYHSTGKTPWETLGSEMRRHKNLFQPLGKGIYRLII
jgi:hypothetical protein